MLIETEKPKLIKCTLFLWHTTIQLSFFAVIALLFYSHPLTNTEKTSGLPPLFL
jgi:hypothetical protein